MFGWLLTEIRIPHDTSAVPGGGLRGIFSVIARRNEARCRIV